MKKQYFEQLLKKLEKKVELANVLGNIKGVSYSDEIVTLNLTGWEIQDLHILWKEKAIGQFGIHKGIQRGSRTKQWKKKK